jgi:hypothetical protein
VTPRASRLEQAPGGLVDVLSLRLRGPLGSWLLERLAPSFAPCQLAATGEAEVLAAEERPVARPNGIRGQARIVFPAPPSSGQVQAGSR